MEECHQIARENKYTTLHFTDRINPTGDANVVKCVSK